MSVIVHCTSMGTAKLDCGTYVADNWDEAERIRQQWLDRGALKVEVRDVDNSRDWNDRSDPVVRQGEREERDAQEGRWEWNDGR